VETGGSTLKMTRRLLPLFTKCAVLLILIPLAKGQATLAQINSTTNPARIAQIGWDELTVPCQRPGLPTKALFFAYTEIEFLGRNTEYARAGSVVARRKRVIEYLGGTPAT
jgi:hypothetical protein